MKLGFGRGRRIAPGNYREESSSGWCWPGLWSGQPSVLLADEPTGNLDFRTGEMIFELLEGLHRSHQLTSVFVTHNLSFARRCDRVLSLEKGGSGTWPDTSGSQPGGRAGVSLVIGGVTFYV